MPQVLLASADRYTKHVLLFSKHNFLLFPQDWALSLALLSSKNTCLSCQVTYFTLTVHFQNIFFLLDIFDLL